MINLKELAMKKTLALLMLTSTLVVAGCSKKPPAELPPAPVGTAQPSAPIQQPSNITQGPVPGSQADFLSKVTADRVFFDTDKSDIDAQAQSTLVSQARWLAQYPNVRITIEGHCDERGTREYNLALGDRRANAAKNFLVSQGVAVSRINTISYGKERPDALGSDEAAYAKNRRAVTITIQ
jgi:peptidoglycan-associated lipoprotein